jgi:hypothetical protein
MKRTHAKRGLTKFSGQARGSLGTSPRHAGRSQWRKIRLRTIAGVAALLVALPLVGGLPPRHRAPGSLWSPLGSVGLRGDSSQLAGDVVAQYEQNYGSVGVNLMRISVAGPGQPLVPVSVAPGCNDFTADTGGAIPIPPGAQPSVGPDSSLIVYQPSSATEWELWEAHEVNGAWSACWGGKLSNISASDGVFPAPYGLAASGISYLATLITESDVSAGAVDHALSLQLVECNGSIAPADRTDCGPSPGQPPEGTWFRLPASLAMPGGLTPFAQLVFRALQNYGAVVTDQAGAVMIQAEDPSDWAVTGHSGVDPITASWQGQPEYTVLNGIPWSQLQAVQR